MRMKREEHYTVYGAIFRAHGGSGLGFYFFGNFFQHVKKLLNFWNFINIKVAKSKLDHLDFYSKLDFLENSEIEIKVEY